MAQREQHERVKLMDRWVEKLLGHKAVLVAILVVIAAASGLAMASFSSRSSDVSFERSDEASASGMRLLMLPMSRLPRAPLLPRCTSMLMALLRGLACTGSKTERGYPKRSMPPEGLRPRRM